MRCASQKLERPRAVPAMKLRRLSVLLLIALLGAGCVGTRVSSAFDPAYNKAVNKLFILAELPTTGWLKTGVYSSSTELFQAHAKDFKAGMESRFEKMGVKSSCAVKTGLELDDSVYTKAIHAYEPEALLLIDCVSSTVNKGGRINAAEFNLSLIDAASNKRFWRANMSVNTEVAIVGPQPTGALFADQLFTALIRQLKSDKMEIFNRLEPL